ncbi:hypothetical protein [Oceaniglobus ichthyenteri]|uniref:hypothetical protein n=1 Tax=Oceaniglobus ichthyenteri TaxID=2136177 RepID=UPI001F0C7586|nr:hypothetical protein [Oceaniglobus ichthyenteri]
MTLIADILLIAGALGAAFYCVVLSRRLTRFTDLEKGVGGAIAVLSAQVDDMTRTLQAAQAQANASGELLSELTSRAEDVARRLELHVAALHDLEDPAEQHTELPMSFRRTEPEVAAPVAEQPKMGGSPPVKSFFSSHRHS